MKLHFEGKSPKFKLELYKKIPGTWTSAKYGEVQPNSVANFKGVPVFGFSNGSGNPAKQGVYSFGSYSRDYPKVLDLSWVVSSDDTTGVTIGAILVLDYDLLVAWDDGTTKSVDALDTTAKYASAYLETTMLFQDQRDILKTLGEVSAYYNSLPASTSITFSYSVNAAAYVAMTSVTDSIIARVKSALSVNSIGSLQLKVEFGVSGDNAPVIEALGIELQ